MSSDPAEPPPGRPPLVPPDLVAELTKLGEQLAARGDHADLAARLEWLIDTLIMRGQLPTSFRALALKIKGQGNRSVVRLAVFRDKYTLESPDIDCAARLPLCGARCCSFDVTLTAQDVAEGIVPYDLTQPYALPRDEGRCVCMNDEAGCTIYAQRPGGCRVYDCRFDPRVWVDYEARIPAPRS
jgi:Putative zinc- or iron-chelating domain